jgi:hypothetical protein
MEREEENAGASSGTNANTSLYLNRIRCWVQRIPECQECRSCRRRIARKPEQRRARVAKDLKRSVGNARLMSVSLQVKNLRLVCPWWTT